MSHFRSNFSFLYRSCCFHLRCLLTFSLFSSVSPVSPFFLLVNPGECKDVHPYNVVSRTLPPSFYIILPLSIVFLPYLKGSFTYIEFLRSFLPYLHFHLILSSHHRPPDTLVFLIISNTDVLLLFLELLSHPFPVSFPSLVFPAVAHCGGFPLFF